MTAASTGGHLPPIGTTLLLAAVIGFAPGLPTLAPEGTAAPGTRVLVVTGGHGFEEEAFFEMFRDNPNITFRAVQHPDAHRLLSRTAGTGYDVVLLYDMWQEIDAEARRAFIGLLEAGKGLVALHHSLCGYQDWPEYRQIVGGRYYVTDTAVGERTWKASTYKHDEWMRVSVVDPTHPVTSGLGASFEILDEVYGGYEVLPDSRPLLTTDHPANTPTLGWWRTYGASRIVYLQLGHDRRAYENASYRRLVANAIAWVGGGGPGRRGSPPGSPSVVRARRGKEPQGAAAPPVLGVQ